MCCWRCPWLFMMLARKPHRVLLAIFLLILFLLPLRCPSIMGYEYIDYEDVEKELLVCSQGRISLPPCPLRQTEEVSNIKGPTFALETLNIQHGGSWSPTSCSFRQRVALVVTNRGRDKQFRTLLRHLHPFLQAQNVDYQIFMVEQSPEHPFNKGLLYNAAFTEITKTGNFCCFILHDIDLLPENLLNLYACSKTPRHMSSNLDTFRYILPYPNLFGGVVSISRDQFEAINGFSNKYFGWGAEDDDFKDRITAQRLEISRWEPRISKYTMLFLLCETGRNCWLNPFPAKFRKGSATLNTSSWPKKFCRYTPGSSSVWSQKSLFSQEKSECSQTFMRLVLVIQICYFLSYYILTISGTFYVIILMYYMYRNFFICNYLCKMFINYYLKR